MDSFNNKIYYPSSGNKYCQSIEDKSFWFRHRNNVIFTIINRFPFYDNFADIGGGNGFQLLNLSNKIQNRQFHLIEPNKLGCINAIRNGLKNVHCSSVNKFAFDKYKVKAVGLFDVIEHIEDDIEFIKLILSKLGKNSMLYLTVPAYDTLWSDVDTYSQHFRRYNKYSIIELSKKCGCDLVYFSYFFTYLTPFIFTLRSIPYRLGIKRNVNEILRDETIKHTTNKISRNIINIFNIIELNLLQKKSIPFGTSCIAVLKN